MLDRRHVVSAFSRAAATYDGAAVLPRRVADELLGRLDLVQLTPARVVEVGSGTGYCVRGLEKRYRRAQIVGIDPTMPMLKRAAARRRWLGRSRFVMGAAETLPLDSASVDLVVSNLALAWCDVSQALAELARVLRPGGLLSFSTLGPDTLKELRRSWESVDDTPHVHEFTDMHQLGDALLAAGLAAPVVDVEWIVLSYRSANEAFADLRRTGGRNAMAGRRAGLTGTHRFARFRAAFEQLRGADGRLPLTFEVVYGHAWAPDAVRAARSLPVRAGRPIAGRGGASA